MEDRRPLARAVRIEGAAVLLLDAWTEFDRLTDEHARSGFHQRDVEEVTVAYVKVQRAAAHLRSLLPISH